MQLTVKKLEACADGKVRAELAGEGLYVKLVADTPEAAKSLTIGGTLVVSAKKE
jgi:hypothetical protein